MKINTKGITIIELMLGIVLFSIVALSITYFISTGTKTCEEAEQTIVIQEESQVVMNQLLNITGNGNSVAQRTAASGDVRFYIFNTDKETNSAKREKILYFKKSSKELYYYEIDSTTSVEDIAKIKSEITGAVSAINYGHLLGEYIKDFCVTIDDDLHQVAFDVTFELTGKEMKTKDAISLRNKYVETSGAYIDIA